MLYALLALVVTFQIQGSDDVEMNTYTLVQRTLTKCMQQELVRLETTDLLYSIYHYFSCLRTLWTECLHKQVLIRQKSGHLETRLPCYHLQAKYIMDGPHKFFHHIKAFQGFQIQLTVLQFHLHRSFYSCVYQEVWVSVHLTETSIQM